MFTGIIEEIGTVKTAFTNKITIECKTILQDINLGDSIAVNGVCLTVTSFDSKSFTADISPETSSITNLKELSYGKTVNLERAMKADGRFGGHIVSGHIDGLGRIKELKKIESFYELIIDLPQELAKYTIKKGSITINGISLTIADVNTKAIKMAIIPHTYENTSLKNIKIGDFVNIEVDLVAKYIEKFLSTSDNKSRISLEYLQEHGF